MVVLYQGLGCLDRTMPKYNRILLERKKRWWPVVLGYTGAAGQPKVGKVLHIGPAKANFLRPGRIILGARFGRVNEEPPTPKAAFISRPSVPITTLCTYLCDNTSTTPILILTILSDHS